MKLAFGISGFVRAVRLLAGVVTWVPLLCFGVDDLVVMSPHNEAIRQEFGNGFSRWLRNTHGQEAHVEWRDVGGSSEALRFVQSEFSKKTNGIGVDCFFGGGQEPHLVLAQRGLLQPIPLGEEILRFIPTEVNGIELRDPAGRWYGAAISSFGILKNLEVQRRLKLPDVQRWEDLADPRLLGWVGAGDPRNSGTMMVMFEGILQYHGWEKGWRLLTQMAGNARRFDRVSSTTAKDVTVGETACGLAIDFYGFSQVAYAGRQTLQFILPMDFAPMSTDPISVLKGAPHPELARRFLEFVLGESGQKLWYLPKGHPEGAVRSSIERLPVRLDLYDRYGDLSNVGTSPFKRAQTFHFDGKKARDRRDVLPALIGAVLIDTHSELKLAWSRVVEHGMADADLRDLGSAPISEAEVFALGAEQWKNPSFRLGKRIEWQTFSRDKYRRLAHGLSAR